MMVLHALLAAEAERQGVSLNTLLVALIAGRQVHRRVTRGVSQGGPHRKPARKHARAKAQFRAVALELAGCEPGAVPARR